VSVCTIRMYIHMHVCVHVTYEHSFCAYHLYLAIVQLVLTNLCFVDSITVSLSIYRYTNLTTLQGQQLMKLSVRLRYQHLCVPKRAHQGTPLGIAIESSPFHGEGV
jgi:hypothetical protein